MLEAGGKVDDTLGGYSRALHAARRKSVEGEGYGCTGYLLKDEWLLLRICWIVGWLAGLGGWKTGWWY